MNLVIVLYSPTILSQLSSALDFFSPDKFVKVVLPVKENVSKYSNFHHKRTEPSRNFKFSVQF